jgi:hypothetical protein
MVGNKWNSLILVNLPFNNILSCVSSTAKTLGLQHLQLLEVGASNGPPDRACVVHHAFMYIYLNTALVYELLVTGKLCHLLLTASQIRKEGLLTKSLHITAFISATILGSYSWGHFPVRLE